MNTAEEILKKHMPKDCWPTGEFGFDNLTNTPIRHIVAAMEEYRSLPVQGMRGWVKASVKKPVGTKSKERINIKYKGKPDVLMFWCDEWFWYDDEVARRVKVQEESWSAIEWLDESICNGTI